MENGRSTVTVADAPFTIRSEVVVAMGSAGVALMLAFVLGVPIVFSEVRVQVQWCGVASSHGIWTGGDWLYSLGCRVSLTSTGFEGISIVGCSIDGNSQNDLRTNGPKTADGLPELRYNDPENVTCLVWTETPPHPVSGSIAHGQFLLSDGRTIPFEGVWG